MRTNVENALAQANEYFMEKSPPHQAARRIGTVFDEMEIPFVIAGALAVNIDGHVRMTAVDRPRDFDDVVQLIRKNELPS